MIGVSSILTLLTEHGLSVGIFAVLIYILLRSEITIKYNAGKKDIKT